MIRNQSDFVMQFIINHVTLYQPVITIQKKEPMIIETIISYKYFKGFFFFFFWTLYSPG